MLCVEIRSTDDGEKRGDDPHVGGDTRSQESGVVSDRVCTLSPVRRSPQVCGGDIAAPDDRVHLQGRDRALRHFKVSVVDTLQGGGGGF